MSAGGMGAMDAIHSGLNRLGYGPDRVLPDYEFSDVGTREAETRRVSLAAFTHSPPSYRSAAFALVETGSGHGPAENLGWLTSLGAPVAFTVVGSEMHVLKVGRSRSVSRIATLAPDDIPAFVEAQRAWWAPDAMRRFKLFGETVAGAPQLDFFDSGLLTGLEEQVQGQLDTLLTRVLDQLREEDGTLGPPALSIVFRMLAAKVLLDRGHPEAASWGTDASSLLDGIDTYYGLGSSPGFDTSTLEPSGEAVSAAWSAMASGLSLRNVSSDDLSFVYENSFVTEQARDELGTHTRRAASSSTLATGFPRSHRRAVRVDFRALLRSRNLPDRGRQAVGRTHGTPFVSREAFIPHPTDQRLRPGGVRLPSCAAFTDPGGLPEQERVEGRSAGSVLLHRMARPHRPEHDRFLQPTLRAVHGQGTEEVCWNGRNGKTKALWAAAHITSRKPAGLALVLPRAFALDASYDNVRRELEGAYGDIEILALPETAFSKAGFETCLVIGKGLRAGSSPGTGTTRLTNSFVSLADFPLFNVRRVPSCERHQERGPAARGKGELWNGELEPIWAELGRRCAPLSSGWEAHRGIEWKKDLQAVAWEPGERPHTRAGYHPNTGMTTFVPPQRGWLDVDPEHLLYAAHLLPWDKPKVLLNAARRSRGPWRVTAFAERGDLAASQQFIGLWSTAEGMSVEALAAVLNGPVANAFLNEASFGKGLRLDDIYRLPLPAKVDEARIGSLVAEYRSLLASPGFDAQKMDRLRQKLLEVDALVLAAYGLAPRMERLLLRYFSGHARLVPFQFDRFYPDATPALPLRDIVGGALARARWRDLAPAFKQVSKEDRNALWGTRA